MLIFDQLNRSDRHLRVLSWITAAGLLVLLAGLWWVQVVRSRSYVEDQRNQSYRTVRVPAPRGKILDRNGIALAENRPSYGISLYLEDRAWREAVQQEYKRTEEAARRAVLTTRRPKAIERLLSWFGYQPTLTQPRRLTSEEKEMLGRQARFSVTSNIVWKLGVALRQPLVLTNETKFNRHYKNRRALPMPILDNLDSEQIARFQEQSIHLPGVDMEMQPMRVYPHDKVAAQVVGCLTHFDNDSAEGELASFYYYMPDYQGYDGIEKTLDAELRGRAGAKAVLVNNLGYRQSETILSPIEAGKDVTLTLDLPLQQAAEKALAEAPDVAQFPVRGAAVVMDVRTGELLALASVPSFNPNDWIPRLPYDVWNTYTNEEIAPLQNKAVFGNYMPGSVFKIIVGLAGLQYGTLDPAEIVHVEPNPYDRAHGMYFVGAMRHGFKDTAPPGDYNFRRAFIKSSNSYFIEQGLRVNPERIVSLAEQFHFGEATGIPLRESRGLLPSPQWMRENRGGWSPVATGNLSIGQGDLNVTPLQIAQATAAIANDGRIVQPRLVLRTASPNQLLAGPPAIHPIIRDELRLNPENLQIVREAMYGDVEDPEGTAFAGFHEKDRHTPILKHIRVGGKTGTAQVQRDNKLHHYTVWFASFGRSETHEYAVVVMVNYGVSGGKTCAPVAAKIYRALEYREQRKPGAPNSLARN